MKIERFKKEKNGKYTIIFEDNSEVTLFEDIIIKNELLIKKEVDVLLLDKLISENNTYEAYDRALSLIDKKLRSEREIRNILSDMGYDNKVINDSIKRMVSEGYIDDKRFTSSFVNDKILLSNWGPFKISKALYELVDEDIVSEVIDKVDYNIWKERVEKIANKKIPSLKGKSRYMAKNKLNQFLFDLGYQSELIDEFVSKIDIDEEEALKKEMSKAYDKLCKKYSGEELNRQIKNHLYRKGFKVSEI